MYIVFDTNKTKALNIINDFCKNNEYSDKVAAKNKFGNAKKSHLQYHRLFLNLSMVARRKAIGTMTK